MAENTKIEYIGKTLLITTNGKRILVIGDLHLGYEGALRETGVLIGDEMLKEYIGELDRVFDKIVSESGKKLLSDVRRGNGVTDGEPYMRGKLNNGVGCIGNNKGIVDEIVLLGDVKHVIGKVMREEWNDVLAFIDYLSDKCSKIVIVKGQHDTLLEPVIRKRGCVELKDYYVLDNVCFMHGNKDFDICYDDGIEYWILGNAHPAVKISDGVKMEKFKCFLTGKYKGKKVTIVPSFIYANEGSDVREYDYRMAWEFDYDKFEVIISEDLKGLDFGKLGKLR